MPMSDSKFNATLNKDDVRSDLLYEAYTDLREGDAPQCPTRSFILHLFTRMSSAICCKKHTQI